MHFPAINNNYIVPFSDPAILGRKLYISVFLTTSITCIIWSISYLQSHTHPPSQSMISYRTNDQRILIILSHVLQYLMCKSIRVVGPRYCKGSFQLWFTTPHVTRGNQGYLQQEQLRTRKNIWAHLLGQEEKQSCVHDCIVMPMLQCWPYHGPHHTNTVLHEVVNTIITLLNNNNWEISVI